MQEKSVLTGHLSELKQKIENGLEELKSSKELYEFKSEYLEGKKSKISGLMKEMKNIAPEERANYGKSVNELKEWALGRFQKARPGCRASGGTRPPDAHPAPRVHPGG